MFSYFWESELHLHNLIFSVDFGGGIIDVILCVITLIMLRKELTEHSQKKVERMIETGALIVAVLVLITVIGLERLGTLQEKRVEKEINAAKNAPLNQPASEISVVAAFKVKGERPENPNWGAPWVADILLCETNQKIGNEYVEASRLMALDADKFDRYVDGTNLEYVLHCHVSDIAVLLPNSFKIPSTTVGWILSNVRFLDIDTKFLPHDSEILGGSAVLTINSGPQKWFEIVPQKDPYPTSGNYGSSYVIIASMTTNAVEIPKK